MNKVIQSDCLIEMGKMDDEFVDLIITDPPYGMSFQSNYRKERYMKIENDNTLVWIDDFIKHTYRILKNNTHFYCFCSWHHVDVFKQSIQKYFEIKNILIWVKNNTGMGDLFGDYAPKHEFIIYARKGKRKLNGRRDSNILEFKRTGNKLHPTEKPVDMFEFLISKSSNEGDLILDPFAGSGTTGVACKNLNRNYILIEKEKEYVDIINNRLK